MNDYAMQFLNLVLGLSIGIASLVSLLVIFRSGTEFDKSDASEFKSIVVSCLLLSIGAISPFFLASGEAATVSWSALSLCYFISLIVLMWYFIVCVEPEGIISALLFTLSTIAGLIAVFNFFYNNQNVYLSLLFWSVGITIIRLYLFLIYVTDKVPKAKS